MTSSSRGPEGGLKRFLDERLGLDALRAAAAHKVVPQHRHSIFYYLGGMALFLFLVQAGTGILLLMYYRPGSNEAWESVQFILTRVQWGWLVRSLHSISANLLILVIMVHLASVYFLRAYRAPREMTWISGLVLFFLFVTFGFSGYLLPWNELAYFATAVGTEIPGTIPGIGDFMVRLVRGGPEVTGATLSRFYGLHVAILPALTTLALALHLLLVQRHGMSVPRGVQERGPPMPFMPNFLLRDLVGWFAALALLISLIVLAPTAPAGALFPFDFLFDPRHLLELGDKADPFAPAPAGIKPEWYFLFMFETLKAIPAEVAGLEGELLGVLSFGVGAAALFLVPFLDRGASGLPSTPLTRGFGAGLVAFALAMCALGGWSMHARGWTAGVLAAGAGAAWIVGAVLLDRRRPAGEPSLLFPAMGWLVVAFIVGMTVLGRLS